VCAISVEEI
jgi:predicted nucleic acid-binding protein